MGRERGGGIGGGLGVEVVERVGDGGGIGDGGGDGGGGDTLNQNCNLLGFLRLLGRWSLESLAGGRIREGLLEGIGGKKNSKENSS